MTEITSLVFMFGALIIDSLEGWTLALFALVIALDSYLGLRAKIVLAFNIIQFFGLISGYIWAVSVGQKQDVAGPYAWAFVVGVWIICVVLFHMFYLLHKLNTRRRANAP